MIEETEERKQKHKEIIENKFIWKPDDWLNDLCIDILYIESEYKVNEQSR